MPPGRELTDWELTDWELTDWGLTVGALADGALADGALADGALPTPCPGHGLIGVPAERDRRGEWPSGAATA